MGYFNIIDKLYIGKNRLKSMVSQNSEYESQTDPVNNQRIFYVALLAIPVNIAHILIFYYKDAGSPQEETWRLGIMIAHFSLMLIMLIAGLLSYLMQRKKLHRPVLSRLFSYGLIMFILVFGVAITIIDQLVTTSITPFLIACLIVSFIFLLRPLISVPLFMISYLVFNRALGLTQTNPSILVSNQVNGITAAGIGICLSVILWRSHVKNIRQHQKIEEQQQLLIQKNNELQYLATHDAMTGLYNRSEFTRLAELEISRMSRHRFDSCLLITDIDYFKKINDQMGHPAGDATIIEFARFLNSQLRKIDFVGRWGGEEFAVLLPHTSLEQGRIAAERIRSNLEKHPIQVQGRMIQISASFGLASLNCDEPMTFDHAYRQADSALYQAKETGRNRVRTAGKTEKEEGSA